VGGSKRWLRWLDDAEGPGLRKRLNRPRRPGTDLRADFPESVGPRTARPEETRLWASWRGALNEEEVRVKNRIIVVAVLVVAAFLAGFLPSYARANRLERALREARREHSLAQVRDLACLAYFQASQKDYGLAAGTSTRFFDRTREAANQASGSSVRKPLEDLLSLRDPITAELAKGDPGVLSDLQMLFVKTRQATAIPSDVPQPE